MERDVNALIAELELRDKLIAEQATTLESQAHTIRLMEHRLDLLLRQRYGRKADKIVPEGARFLFDTTPDDQALQEDASPTVEVKPHARRKKGGGGRMAIPVHMERRRVEHDVPEEERTCSCCGKAYRAIGEEIVEQLDFIPGSCYAKEHVTKKYAAACSCPQEKPVVRAEKPVQPIDKGIAGPGLLAIIAVMKYGDHLPLYRQAKQVFKREGIEIPESSMCRWMGDMADLCQPLYELMKTRVLKSLVIHTDDSPVNVRTEGQGIRRGYFWPYVGDEANPYIVYDFTTHHGRAGPQAFLGDYDGYVQCDAASVYDELFKPKNKTKPHPIEIGCWAHARRKFTDAQKTDVDRAVQATARIGMLYDVEREAKTLSHEERRALRQEKSLPVLDAFFKWCNSQFSPDPAKPTVLPKSPMGHALSYALGNELALRRYCEHGRLAIDNNAAERALRGVAIGRKNWMFVGSPRGGKTAATLFTLLAGAKRHDLDPWKYLRDVIIRLSDLNPRELELLLPDRWSEKHSDYSAR